MELEITSESAFEFAIRADGVDHWLVQRGGEWRLDGRWIASKSIDGPEALARALRVVLGYGLNLRTKTAIEGRS